MSAKPEINTPEVEQRKNTPQPAISLNLSAINNSLADILSTRLHSKDFTDTRFSYIAIRLRIMCLFFAITVPLFAFFDFLTFPFEQAKNLLGSRIALSIALFILAYNSRQQASVLVTRIILSVAFLLPTIFYICTMLCFNTMPVASIPLVFSMMPYLIVAMAGLFPLTVAGGLFLVAIIFVPLSLLEFNQFNGDYLQLFYKFWLFSLFAGISLWLQSGQLLMLMKLYRESTIDPLTGLINRRVLLRQARLEEQHSAQDSIPFSVIMFDLDRFKRINDTYGHMIGDRVLTMVGNVMRREFRSSDIIARFGGEEFVAILPGLSIEQSIDVAKRIANAIRDEAVALNDGNFIHVTSSIGVTQYQQNESIEATFKRVDDLLYRAKATGRDTVVTDHALVS